MITRHYYSTSEININSSKEEELKTISKKSLGEDHQEIAQEHIPNPLLKKTYLEFNSKLIIAQNKFLQRISENPQFADEISDRFRLDCINSKTALLIGCRKYVVDVISISEDAIRNLDSDTKDKLVIMFKDNPNRETILRKYDIYASKYLSHRGVDHAHSI